ncbi:hypothetical protein HOE67_02420 [Candidatus Peregrinibacteria bacterium]|jgi:hypothetical protein|nr:hypothetical protein [Candidatus Peregrinibacteria bacterium]MBT4055944.1 hypothetical protein [Candidatus Peregrinibacteria bacterium]
MILTTPTRRKLDRISRSVLDNPDSSTEDREASMLAYGDLCHKAAKICDDSFRYNDPEKTDFGRPISPEGAVECLRDPERAVKFIRAAYNGLLHLKKVFPGEKLDVLYGGSGPYATLFYPVLRRFPKDEVDVEIVDYHPSSLVIAESLAVKFGVRKYLSGLNQKDLTKYNPGKQFHMIVSEVMDAGLFHEPQVAVEYNLRQFLKEGGLFVPDTVDISLAARGITDNEGSDIELLGKIFSLGSDVRGRIANISDFRISGGARIPQHLASHEMIRLLLATHVKVFDSLELAPGESGITHYVKLPKFKASDVAGKEVFASYKPGRSWSDVDCAII